MSVCGAVLIVCTERGRAIDGMVSSKSGKVTAREGSKVRSEETPLDKPDKILPVPPPQFNTFPKLPSMYKAHSELRGLFVTL